MNKPSQFPDIFIWVLEWLNHEVSQALDQDRVIQMKHFGVAITHVISHWIDVQKECRIGGAEVQVALVQMIDIQELDIL